MIHCYNIRYLLELENKVWHLNSSTNPRQCYKRQMPIHVLFTRWVSVVEFHDQALSIGKVFGQESTVVKWNYQILCLHLVTVRQKVPILDFQSEFSMSKIIRIFLKKIIEEYQFKRTFFVKSIFGWLQFLNHFITKMTPNFWWTVTWWRPNIW